MRNARTMNDFSEVQYGLQLLESAYAGPIGNRLRTCLARTDAGICSKIEKLFFGWSPRFPEITYVTCISEHVVKTEEGIGRLSMWRAYGGPTSVAVVLNNSPFLEPTDVMEIFTNPVLYADKQRFDKEFDRMTTNLENAGQILNRLGRQEIENRLFRAFLVATVCTKHPGFLEEREWRVIHADQIHPSTNLMKEVELVRGVPQFVYKIPLKDIPAPSGGAGFHGAEVKDLLNHVIIGPSQNGPIVRDAIVHLLERAGVPDATRKVFISGIPLRGP